MKNKRLNLLHGNFKDATNTKCTLSVKDNNLSIGVLRPTLVIYSRLEDKSLVVETPKDVKINSKIYLSQQMVADLLPMLELFAATGRIEYNDDVEGSGG